MKQSLGDLNPQEEVDLNHCINSNQNEQAQLCFTRDGYLDGVMDDLTASNKKNK